MPPSPPPPLPPLAPNEQLVAAAHLVVVSLTGSGDVSTFDGAKRTVIAESVATAANVPTADVIVSVSAGSVVIEVTIVTSSASAQSAASAALAPSVASADAATALLAAAGVSVLAAPVVATRVGSVIISSPQPPPPPSFPPDTSTSSRRAMHIAHGVCMALAFAFCFPLGAMVPRFSPLSTARAVATHRAVQLTGALLATAGFGVAVAMTTEYVAHFSTTHARVGLALFVIMWLQVLLGLLRPHKPEAPELASTPRRVWQAAHVTLGLTTIGLATWQPFTGIALAIDASQMYFAWFLLLGAALLAGVAMIFCGRKGAGAPGSGAKAHV